MFTVEVLGGLPWGHCCEQSTAVKILSIAETRA